MTMENPSEADRPDVVVIITDQERAPVPYETDELKAWRREVLTGRRWFDDNGVSFGRHYTGSLACVPSRPTLFTGQFPDLHGVTQTDGLGKRADDSRMRWLPPGEVPTLGNWFRALGYDTHYDGKWHISHADLVDPDSGRPLRTNDSSGHVFVEAVDAYLEADPLGPYGFSGWVGPEPHGAGMANSGLVRDPLIADRVVAWLEDRFRRRAEGDPSAERPFLLVASFVNPHDIVLFPGWVRQDPIRSSPLDPPSVPPAPTSEEDLSTKPAAQAAYRAAYPTGYGPSAVVGQAYASNAQKYRDLYYRLHAEVDGPVDRVRRTVTDAVEAGAGRSTVMVRTADHGELLGAHGGLHQKWFNLYDEATRVPFTIARVGPAPTTGRVIDEMPTSHVDLVPTLLAAAGADVTGLAADLSADFTEVHPLPGRNLMPLIDGDEAPDPRRAVYLMTRDNILEGDTAASAAARAAGVDEDPPGPLRIRVPAGVGSNFEAVVARLEDEQATGGAGHLWKLVRTFDDPATWTEPGVRHLSADEPGNPVYRSEPLEDEWELYDLTEDPIEVENLASDPGSRPVLEHMRTALGRLRGDSVPGRNRPWPYVRRKGSPSTERSVAKAARNLGAMATTGLGQVSDRIRRSVGDNSEDS